MAIVEVVMESFGNALGTMVNFLPALIGALIVLLIGWLAGRAAGKIVGTIVDKTVIDDAVDKTIIGDSLKKSGMNTVGFFDALVRWFIYVVFIMAAINVLNLPMLTEFMNQLVLYIPHLIAGVVVLVVGLVLVDFLMDWVGGQLTSREVAFGDLIAPLLRALFSLLVVVLALDQMLIDTSILYTFLVPLAWGLGIGLAVALGIGLGWGTKDIVADYMKKRLAPESA